MELELNRTQLTGYDMVLDTTVTREETMETIVPDACPDILRLVDTQGTILLKSKAVSDGRVTLTGTARLAVLYLPDGGTGLNRLEVNIPFSISTEESGLKSGCLVTAMPRVAAADTRTVNPRKIVTRVQIVVHVCAYQAGGASLCTRIDALDGTVEQRKETCRPYCIAAVQEKPITVEDNLTIPAGRPAAEEVLGSRVALSCHESKLIGSKLIFKGETAVRLLYRPVGGGLDAVDFTLPFSQITELVGAGEEGECTVELCLTGAEFTLGGDGRTVSVSLSVLTQAILREERTVEVLADAYSVCCPMRTERAAYDYSMLHAQAIGLQTVRQIIESGIPIKTVVDACCTVNRTAQSREGSQLRLSAGLTVTALCLTEDSDCCAVSRHFEVSCLVDAPEECTCLFSCRCGDVIATPTADGVEVRCSVEFPYLCLRPVHVEVVQEAAVEDCDEEERVRRPSIVLRSLGRSESLWDAAKQYSTTVEDIMRANELESEQPKAGTLLLIPRKR